MTSRNLASRILAAVVRRLPSDWLARYGYTPLLLETFVERERFRGTSYRAANWILLGSTKGRGKLDTRNLYALPVKDILVYPMAKDFRQLLCCSAQQPPDLLPRSEDSLIQPRHP